MESTEDMTSFYNASHSTVTSYLARSVVNFVLTGEVRSDLEDLENSECRVF